MNAKDLADKTIDIVRSYLESKMLPVHTQLGALHSAMASRVTKEEAETSLREALKAYAPFDLALLEAKIEEVKAAIPEAIQGPVGEAGSPGAAMDVLTEDVDLTTPLPAGKLLSMEGGLWKSVEGAEGKTEWKCVVEGIKDIKIESTDERNFTLFVERTSGEVIEKKMFIPVMLYRGVYTEGKEYQIGDTVTAKGSLWHCNENTTDKPGDGKAWTLAAKRGQDAKGA